MLREVLQAIETAAGPVHVAALSQQLGIDRSALEGMIDYWVRKGRLQARSAADTVCAPSMSHCGGSCTGAVACPFVARMPKTFTVELSTLRQSNHNAPSTPAVILQESPIDTTPKTLAA